MQVDMSAEAVTRRMIALDQLWELAVALKSSTIIDDEVVERPEPDDTHSASDHRKE